MVKYDEETLEKTFKSAASLRIRRKEKGDDRYSGDAGYWEGGRCNWGGSHNLSEDCHTIAEAFRKIASLKDASKELKECTSKEEFDAKKWEISQRAREAADGLQIRTGYASSMFGICIIWADYSSFLESKIKPFRNDINRFAGQIDKEDYKFIQELKDLELERTQIEARMKENKRKAQAEKDPNKRAILLQLIEEDGKRLEENLRKQKAIPTSNLRFEPDKYVSDLINAMKEAIEKGGKNIGNGSGSSGGNRRKPNQPDPFGGSSWIDPDPNSIPKTPKSRSSNQAEPRNNQQLILIIVAVAAVMFFMLQKEPSPKYAEDYNY